MQPGGQSLVDRLLAAKNTIAGQALAKVVCKATTEEIMGPKRKHLDFLLQATNEMNVSIPQLADLLIERTQNSSWVVSFKSLITIHHLMCFGNERFEAYMASHNHRLQPAAYLDRMGMPGGDMSNYIRRYASYLNEKRESYKLMGYDFCKIKRGKDDGVLRTMPTEKLLKALPILQKQLDALLEFDVTPNELTNGVINSCFFLLIKDLIRLYAAFNDGMINLLEKYFDMNKKQCREALDIYKKFLDRTDKVSNFLKVAETSGMERSEIPDLSRAPSSLLEALENHLAHMEGKKLPSQSSISRQQTEQDLKSFSRDLIFNDTDDSQKVLEEEAKALAQFNRNKDTVSPTTVPTASSGNGFGIPDFFSSQPPAPATTPSSSNGQYGVVPPAAHQQPSFTDDIFSLATPPSQTASNSFFNQSAPLTSNTNPSATSAAFSPFQPSPFANVLDTSVSKTNFFDDILQPTNVTSGKSTTNPSGSSLFATTSNIPPAGKPFQSGDLNSSLNQLFENLDIKDRSKIGKDHQWTPGDSKNQQKIGMGATATITNTSSPWSNTSNMSSPFGGMPMQPTTMWQQPAPAAAAASTNPFAAPPTGSTQMPFGNPMGTRPTMGSTNTNPFAAQPSFGNSPFGQPTKPNQTQINDPFGSL